MAPVGVDPFGAVRSNPLDLSAPSPAAPAEQLCPHCAASNLPGALYCENCGYDFTTGQLPRPLAPPAGVPALPTSPLPADLLPPPFPPSPAGPSPAGPSPAGASSMPPPLPSPPSMPAPALVGDPGSSAASSVASTAAGPARSDAPDAGAGTAGANTAGANTAGMSTVPLVTPTSGPGHVEWVAEVWIDPDWYASQDVSEPCPSAGMPSVVPILERTVLVGRQSTSRNLHPQIDLSSDNGVSRRHAQLNSDGQRWWVEDLQSANGTFVGSAGQALPTTPVPAGQRVELAEDDRIFLGAWTRLVVRRATVEESALGA